MTYCTVKGCHNASQKNNKDKKITFHSFPSNPIVAAQWIERIRLNRRELCWKPTKCTKICSEHFNDNEKYITKGDLCKLRQGAVPTKELHIFCKDVSADDLKYCRDLDKTQLDASSNEDDNFFVKINSNEAQALNANISQGNETDLESIFDTLRNSALRKKLSKKLALQRRQSEKIRMLQQRIRRLKKNNLSLKNNNLSLKKKLNKLQNKVRVHTESAVTGA